MGIVTNLLWRARGVYETPSAAAQIGPKEGELKPLEHLPGAPKDREVLLCLNKGKVIGDARLVATQSDMVIGQLQSLHGVEHPAEHWTFKQRRLRWTTRVQGVSFLLAVAAGENFYHWLFECLPRLKFLDQAGLNWEHIDHFLINSISFPFQTQTLDILGIPAHKRVCCSKSRVLKCERLLVPPMPNEDPACVPQWVCEFLRQRFLPTDRPTEGNRLIYLSRRTARKRRLSNEADIEQLARSRHFEILCPDALPFAKQVEAFSQARAIFGPHGAAFANLVFAPPHTRVLELFHPSHQIENYRVLSHNLGFSYHRIVGSGGEGEAFSEKLEPYEVSCTEVEKLLDQWAS